jgi:PAS domain S-box-containing protein
MDWADAQQTMRDGGADVIDTIFKTDARQLIYEFTPPYTKLDVPIFFHKSISGIVDIASLRGFAVGVKDGDACLEFLRSHRLDNFRLYNSYSNLIAGAASGDVKIFCMDAPPAVYLLHHRGIEKEFMQTEAIYSGEFHRAVAKGNTAMLKTIETGMAQITEAEQQAIHEKWHGKKVAAATPSFIEQYLGYIALGIALLVLLLAFGNFTLRRSVKVKTAALNDSLTALRHTQRISNEALEQLQATLNAIPDLLLEVDADGVIHNLESPRVNWLPVAKQEIIGKSLSELLPHGTGSLAMAALRDAVDKGHSEGKQYSLDLPKGKMWFDVSVARMRTPPGKPMRFIAIVRDITERGKATAALSDSVKEKMALLNEVHHRVKNNLQVITSMLRLEANRSTHAETKAVLRDMQGRIRTMALLHETLNHSGALSSVDLASYLRQLCTQAFRAQSNNNGSVGLLLELSGQRVDMDQATTCGLLVNELITNSLKHAFPDNRRGSVTISLKAAEDRPDEPDAPPKLQLDVKDNGVGLPPDYDIKRAKSLGMQLISDLSQQLGATLQISSGPGTVISIQFSPTSPRVFPPAR